ncbi:MAG: mandelate racemase/muconate lactonizing enzyme family protein [Pirellulaceae bacterium]|jgi:L-alanine-DL-glutamate epimerase-like enolase superfamily enzyme|nr:mandelate racemase/muconate lactonizing enzyme family protein [Pirellulaceae bacterium]MDP7019514.1 mandelate racemase/muconate lactonizing enzyme family protein [Pirellulaceae bacterium]
MRIVELQTTIVSVPYRRREVSSRVDRGGVTDVIVKLTADNGLVGWGESCSGADAASIEQAVQAARPFVIGRDPWQSEAIARDFFGQGLWDYRAMTGNFAFAGIDQALWDLCGKECGQPLYRLFGGALRAEVDYFCYLARGAAEDLREQCRSAVELGYTCFYLKVGVDAAAETEMLDTVRRTIGSAGKIRIDANEAWSVADAARLINQWDERFGIDFVEAPVPIDPVDNMLDLRRRVSVALCANEGLWREADAMRIIRSRCADVLCFSSYWVGTLRRFRSLCHAAHLEGQRVCKHTHGELGLAAAAGQHVMLSIPNATDGVQQTSAMMEHELLTVATPIAGGPRWAAIEAPGLGVEVDEEKLREYHDVYCRDGQFLPYRLP